MKTKTPKKLSGKRKRLPDKREVKVNTKEPSEKSVYLSKIKSNRTGYPEMIALDQLMIITEHWLSDTQFFKGEIQFLYNLISKYFTWLTEDENIKSTKEIAHDLSRLEKERKGIEQEIHQHIRTYRNLFENPFSHDRKKFQSEHAKLEKELTELVKDFRYIKQKTFALTESVIQSEKVKHLIKDQEIIEL